MDSLGQGGEGPANVSGPKSVLVKKVNEREEDAGLGWIRCVVRAVDDGSNQVVELLRDLTSDWGTLFVDVFK